MKVAWHGNRPKKNVRSRTIKAYFADHCMMFGTSYRNWWDQLGEYCRRFKHPMPQIEVSTEPWIGYGGLKWCEEKEFQAQLDIEGAGRTVADFVFRPPNRVELNCLRSEFGS